MSSPASELRNIYENAVAALEKPDHRGIHQTARLVIEATPAEVREAWNKLPRLQDAQITSEHGKALLNIANCVAILNSDRPLQGLVWWDDFSS